MRSRKCLFILFVSLFFAFSIRATDHLKPIMEPYQLLGKRMVFSNWFYIRAGHFIWVDEAGNKVNTERNVMLDEHAARFISHNMANGVKLFTEKAERQIPFLTKDRTWDQLAISVQTLIHDKERYRIWGACWSDKSQRKCTFESTDGLNWIKPDLGITEFNGSKQNNLLDVRFPRFSDGGQPNRDHFWSVFIDPHSPPEERYKTIWMSRISYEDFINKYKKTRRWSFYAIEKNNPGVEAPVLRASVSPDGYHWKALPDPITIEENDTQNIAYYDQSIRKYVLYTWDYMVGSRAPGIPYARGFHKWVSCRAIGRTGE